MTDQQQFFSVVQCAQDWYASVGEWLSQADFDEALERMDRLAQFAFHLLRLTEFVKRRRKPAGLHLPSGMRAPEDQPGTY